MLEALDTAAREHFSPLVARARQFRDKIETFPLQRFQRLLILAGIVLVYLLVTSLQARRELWHDELYTYYIAKAPSISQLFQEIKLDLNPPLMYLAERASLHVLGDNNYAARFPSIIAFLFGSLCFYAFVSRRLRPVYGILAMLVFLVYTV